jgi:hypothetical protein
MRVLVLLCLLAGSAAAQALKPGPPHVVAIETRDMRVEFAGDRAWTMYRILHKGAVVTDKVGFYGTVFAAEGGKWIGTGHNEGGIEKIESVTLTVDGTPRELADNAEYRCARAVIEKRSMMGPLKLQATYLVTDDALMERHRYEVMEDVKIGTLYAFMHPWVPATNEWIAQMPDGAMRGGSFDQSGDFKLKDDPKWTAIYNPEVKRAMLAWYPQPLAGQGVKTGYWDKSVYHKLYNQIFSHAEVKKGLKFEAEIVIRGAECEPEGWKEAVKALAAETQALAAAGKLGW